MQHKILKPDQMIAMIDYPPLHSPGALASYYQKLKKGEEIQVLPLIHVSVALPYFMKFEDRFSTYRDQLKKFLTEHPRAEYFMLGGKHRSAASTILGKTIPGIVLVDDHDVSEFLDWSKSGKSSGVLGVGENFEKTLAILEDHFFRHKRFWTMEEKTKVMIKNGDVPTYMLEDSPLIQM